MIVQYFWLMDVYFYLLFLQNNGAKLIPYMVAITVVMVLQTISWAIILLIVSDLIRWRIQWEGGVPKCVNKLGFQLFRNLILKLKSTDYCFSVFVVY